MVKNGWHYRSLLKISFVCERIATWVSQFWAELFFVSLSGATNMTSVCSCCILRAFWSTWERLLGWPQRNQKKTVQQTWNMSFMWVTNRLPLRRFVQGREVLASKAFKSFRSEPMPSWNNSTNRSRQRSCLIWQLPTKEPLTYSIQYVSVRFSNSYLNIYIYINDQKCKRINK